MAAEVFKHGSEDLLDQLTDFFQKCLRAVELSQEWLHAAIANLYKKKAKKSECCNYRVLSTLDEAV